MVSILERKNLQIQVREDVLKGDGQIQHLFSGSWRLFRPYNSEACNHRRVQASLQKMIEDPRTIISDVSINDSQSEASAAAMNVVKDSVSMIPKQVQQRVLREVIHEFQLNDSHHAAVSSVFNQYLSLIQGPPGKGKANAASALDGSQSIA